MTEYSSHVGVIHDDQFCKALERFKLGSFVKAEKVPYGIMGQNVFLTSTTGEYVLRGRPFYPHQFAVERFMVDHLQERTDVPVPWPYLVDTDQDIFGWPYVIMPRMAGLQLFDPQIKAELSREERFTIARTMGETLARLHRFEWDYAGLHVDESTIKPFEPDYGTWIISKIRGGINIAKEAASITEDDISWINDMIDQNLAALNAPFQPCFVMGDFKEDNVVFSHDDDTWHVTGVFDFAFSHFGNGEADLARQHAMYTEEDPSLAQEFIDSYTRNRPPRDGFSQRMSMFILDERFAIWNWAKGQKRVWWDDSLSFREWIRPYMLFM